MKFLALTFFVLNLLLIDVAGAEFGHSPASINLSPASINLSFPNIKSAPDRSKLLVPPSVLFPSLLSSLNYLRCYKVFHSNTISKDVSLFKSSTVRIIYRNTNNKLYPLGTGFFIDKNTVVTNHHVLEGIYSNPLTRDFFVLDLFGNILPTKVKAISLQLDLALVEVDTSKSPVKYKPLKIKKEEAKKDEIFYVFKEDFSIKSDEKLEASDETRYRSLKLFYMSGESLYAPFGEHSGMSGGPVVDSEGKLAFVLFSSIKRIGKILFGIKVEELKEMITISKDKNLKNERVFCNRKGLSFKECMKEITGESVK